jgi:hypothetical protein
VEAQQTRAQAAAVSTATASCETLKQCAGPRIAGANFALVSSPQASVAAATKRWGDYVKVQLIITNMGHDALRFDPTQIIVNTADRRMLNVVQVSEIRTTSTEHIGFGSFNPMALPGATQPDVSGGSGPVQGGQVILRGPNGEPVSSDPANRTFAEIQKRHLQQHEAELKKMLAGELVSSEIAPGETIAGFVLVPGGKENDPVKVEVRFGPKFKVPLR